MSEQRQTALILGATSDIGRAIAHRLARAGYAVQLAGRHSEQLKRDARDLEIRYGVPASVHIFDILQPKTQKAMLEGLKATPDVAICVIGLLGNQRENETDSVAAEQVMNVNYVGPARLLGLLANRFEERGSGTLVGISSAAGDRGRATNYVYGSAKAGFTAFLSGLRNRLSRCGVHVVTIKPGFVRTRMTEDMTLPARLTAEPDEVARAVLRAIDSARNVVYVRPIWRLIMFVIRSIPEQIFKRLTL